MMHSAGSGGSTPANRVASLLLALDQIDGHRESARKHELACLRMASDCMQLVGKIQDGNLQRRFLELARQLTAAAEPASASRSRLELKPDALPLAL